MISYEDLVEIARICLEQARKAERANLAANAEYAKPTVLISAEARIACDRHRVAQRQENRRDPS
jgi:hypothetical protein